MKTDTGKAMGGQDGTTINISETVNDLLIHSAEELGFVHEYCTVDTQERIQLVIGQSLFAIALMMYRQYQEDGFDN